MRHKLEIEIARLRGKHETSINCSYRSLRYLQLNRMKDQRRALREVWREESQWSGEGCRETAVESNHKFLTYPPELRPT